MSTRVQCLIGALLGVVLLFSACSNKPDDGAVGSTAQVTELQARAADPADPCGLLAPAEVEAALGKLAAPPFRVGQNGPEADGSRCAYLTPDWRTLQIGITEEGGAALLKMIAMPAGMAESAQLKGKLPVPQFADFAGDWDEARVVGCCLLDALIGDTMLDLNFAATRLTLPQGAQLMNVALGRIAKRVAVDGNAGVDAALAREAARPRERAVCGLLSRAEVEAILGPLLEAPSGSNRSCLYRHKRKGMDGKELDWPVELKIEWRGGYASLREETKMVGEVAGALLGHGGGDVTSAPAAIVGPWDEAAKTIDFLAVKQDVLMRVDLRTTTEEIARQLVGKAMAKL